MSSENKSPKRTTNKRTWPLQTLCMVSCMQYYFHPMTAKSERAYSALVLASALVLGCEKSAPARSSLESVGTPGSHYDAATTRFKERVEAELSGRVVIRVFPASQLGSDQEMLNGLRLGTLEMHLPSSVLHSSEPLLSLFELPFLFQDRAQVRRVVSGTGGRADSGGSPKAGSRAPGILGERVPGDHQQWKAGGPAGRPARNQAANPQRSRARQAVQFKLLGASPTSMAFGELFTALRRGVVDGQENPLSQIVSARLYEVQTYLSLSRHVYSPAYPLMSRRFFDYAARGRPPPATRHRGRGG
jgi:TRAP-type C4-dicarboxylate transport system substrate-binding protein